MVETMIPAEVLSSTRKRAQAGAYGELENLLWFREHEDEWKVERTLMTAYREYADAMMISPDTLRENLAKIRNYTPADLKRWISKGLWLGHFERANAIAKAFFLNSGIQPSFSTAPASNSSRLICRNRIRGT